jgi:transposase
MEHLGIDLSKKYFDVTLKKGSGKQVYAQFDNREPGFAKLSKWLAKQQVEELHVCMEATNIYWEALADYLHEQGYIVSVVNPARIKGFAISQLQRNKTDKLDSQVIVTFCELLSPQPWQPPTEAQRKLKRLMRHRQALTKSRTQHLNQLADCQDEEVRASLEVVLATLQSQIDHLNQRISDHIKQDDTLATHKALLLSIKGFGDQTVHLLLAEMYDLADYASARAAAADAGVTPAHYQSGDTIRRKPKMSKVGKAAVRGALFWPAVTAIRHNPIVKALADRLRQRGKSKMCIIGAAMRKLLHIAYGVLKHQTPFDPNFLSP